MGQAMIWALGIFGVILVFGIISMLVKCYRKVEQGTALIRNGAGGTKVRFTGMFVIPVLHRAELMDISVKRIEIDRMGETGLVCKDNMRADVKVAFFVRVNVGEGDVKRVAQSLGCKRASDPKALVEFFDAKFSEALKTVGKQFDFEELYTNRMAFKDEILKIIGTDLNGYVLDDAAIDYLEQTPLTKMDSSNILDAEGIKKIIDRTAQQAILSNDITRDKEKTIKKQDVEARETILELEKQLADAEQRQLREIAEITAREEAAALKTQQEELLKSERARITTEEEVGIAEENKDRQVIVAQKSKERTEKVEIERVERERELENVERQRVVTLADIEKEKAVEVEKKNIQEVIRERVAVENQVVAEEERIKDTQAFAGADRSKKVAITKAEEQAEQNKTTEVVAAQTARDASKLAAEQLVIEADANRDASEREAHARKTIADAKAEEEAVLGIGEARAIEAKAGANEKYGIAAANVLQKKAEAEALGITAKADAKEKDGTAEATVMHRKYTAEAEGIKEKADAMKLFDAVGKEHEEFKLRLNKDLDVELAGINVEKEIAEQQAVIVGEALKQARIDIVGGESEFFDKIVSSITRGKSVDRMVDASTTLTDVKETFFNGSPEYFKRQLKQFTEQFGMSTEDVKNLSVAALVAKMTTLTDDSQTQAMLDKIGTAAREFGMADKQVSKLLGT